TNPRNTTMPRERCGTGFREECWRAAAATRCSKARPSTSASWCRSLRASTPQRSISIRPNTRRQRNSAATPATSTSWWWWRDSPRRNSALRRVGKGAQDEAYQQNDPRDARRAHAVGVAISHGRTFATPHAWARRDRNATRVDSAAFTRLCPPYGASAPVARVDAVEQAQEGRPVGRAAAAVVLLVLPGGLLADVRRDLDQVATRRFHPELDVGRLEQVLHQHERLAHGLAHGEQAVVVHDEGAVLAERGVDAGALVEILGDALIRVIAHAVVEADGRLRHHAQAVLQAGQRHAELGVHVHRAVDVRPRRQHAAVQREAR